jgi:hypothetical protein
MIHDQIFMAEQHRSDLLADAAATRSWRKARRGSARGGKRLTRRFPRLTA